MSRERKGTTSNPRDSPLDDILGNLDDFKVLDAWEDNSNSDKGGVKVKAEPRDENTSSSRDSRKRSSDPRSSRSDHHGKSREKSWERSRDPRMRNRSPPRRRSPPRAAGAASFLQDLKETLASSGQDTSFIDDFSKNPNDRRPPHRRNQQYPNRFNQRQYMQQQNMMNNNQMMNNNYGQMMPNMNMHMNYQQYSAPQFPQYVNMYDLAGVPTYPGQLQPQNMQVGTPQPVPPPGISPNSSSQQWSPQPVNNVTQQQQSYQINEGSNVARQGNSAPKKQPSNALKALQSGKLNLTDILRQKSKQQSKELSQSTIASNREQVKVTCMKASDIILYLEKMKHLMPFTCAMTEVQTPPVKQISTNKYTSPLLLSDGNALFQFQTPPSRARIALERNPLKIFQEPTSTLLPLARNMKLDMLELSLKVKQQILTKPKEQEKKVVPPPKPIVPSPSVPREVDLKNVPKFQDKGSQASVKCQTCNIRDAITKQAKTVGTYTETMPLVDASTQSDNIDGSFTFTIDAARLRKVTFEEDHLLTDLSNRFGFAYEGNQFSPQRDVTNTARRGLNQIERWQATNMEDERLNTFSNPENPANANFVSFSPPHQSIFTRVGPKIPVHTPSPQCHFERSDMYEYKVPSPTGYRNRSRSVSPYSRPAIRNRSPGSPSRMRRNRSRSNSPLRVLSPVGRNRSPVRRSRSPIRNRNSPKRTRYDGWNEDYSIKDRRGRY